MTSQEKLLAISSLNEQQLRRAVLIPLLSKMGYLEPVEHHHSNERGKDIVCKERDDKFEMSSFIALVVKTGDINASVSSPDSIFVVINQVKQCFNEPYRDIYQLREVQIDKCFVVTSGRITSPVMDAALGSLKQDKLDKLIKFIDGNLLVTWIDKHFQEYWLEQENEKEALLKSRNAMLQNLSKVVHKLIDDPEKRIRALKMMDDANFQIEFNHFESISKYVADIGYQRIEFDEIDPYYSELPIYNQNEPIQSTLTKLHKSARKVLYEMDDVIEILKKLAVEKDPMKAFELTEELSSHVGGYGFQFKADDVGEDDNFFLAIKDYRKKRDFLEKAGLSEFYKELSANLKAAAQSGLADFFRMQPKDKRDLWFCVKIEFSISEKRAVELRQFVIKQTPMLDERHPEWKIPKNLCVESEPNKSITIKIAPNLFGFFKEETMSPQNKAEQLLWNFQTSLDDSFFPMTGFVEDDSSS